MLWDLDFDKKWYLVVFTLCALPLVAICSPSPVSSVFLRPDSDTSPGPHVIRRRRGTITPATAAYNHRIMGQRLMKDGGHLFALFFHHHQTPQNSWILRRRLIILSLSLCGRWAGDNTDAIGRGWGSGWHMRSEVLWGFNAWGLILGDIPEGDVMGPECWRIKVDLRRVSTPPPPKLSDYLVMYSDRRLQRFGWTVCGGRTICGF